jgi:hypothetical protein
MALVTGTLAIGGAVAAGAGALGWMFDQGGDAVEQSAKASTRPIKWAVGGLAVYYGGRYLLRKRKG